MAPVSIGRPMFFRSIKGTKLQMIQTCCMIGVVVAISLALLRLESEPASASMKLELYSKSNYTRKHNGWVSKNLKASQPVKSRETGKAKTILSIKGSSSNFIKVNLQPVLRKDKYTDILLEFITIDPSQFTKTLKHFVHLKNLSLVNVKLDGSDKDLWNWNFTRVMLPFLEEFTIDLTIGFRDQYRDYLPQLTESNLRSLLFYDKSSQLVYTEETKEFSDKLVVDGVEVAIKVDGWYVLSLRQLKDKSFDVMVAVTFANSFMETVNTYLNVTSLAMTECEVAKAQIPTGLTYINFYRVRFIDTDIEEVLENMNNLSQLFIELKDATFSVSRIPESVKELGIADITTAKYRQGDECYAKKLGVGFPMDSEVLANLDSIFVQLETIGIFEPTDGSGENGLQHITLQSVYKSSATWAYFEGFSRKGIAFSNNRTQTEADMENFLDSVGVNPEGTYFLLVRNSSVDAWSHKMVTDEIRLRYRYQFLGWDRFISESMYDAYFSQYQT